MRSAVAGNLQAWLPDSPRWLLLSGNGREEAEGALRRAWGKYGNDSSCVRTELARIESSVEECQKLKSGEHLPLMVLCASMLLSSIFNAQFANRLVASLLAVLPPSNSRTAGSRDR